MKHNPYKIVQMFEEEIAEYTGAPYAVALDNCTDALFLCCTYLNVKNVTIPKKTYLSVPQAVMASGGKLSFDDVEWKGLYQLKPYPIWDAAKRLTSNMYVPGQFMTLSFHIKKLLPIWKGGMILTDDAEAADWFKKARYEGRSEKYYKDDDITFHGWNMYMTPQQAAHGLSMFQNYPEHMSDLGEDNGYRDLTEFTVFKDTKTIE